VPGSVRDAAGQGSGMMVMAIVDDGPGAKAGVMAGDILLTLDGTPAVGRVAAVLDADSVGREVDLRVLRAGAIRDLRATISARP
jgi:S1-C subfamily serine protease